MISPEGFFTKGKYQGYSIRASAIIPPDYLRWLYWMLDLGTEADKQILSELNRRGEPNTDAKNNQAGRDVFHKAQAPGGKRTHRASSASAPRSLPSVDKKILEEIIAAGRQALAKRHHPDVGGDGEKMKAINIAADTALEWVRGL